MAKTPLFRHLQRALALARAANATGASSAEVVDRFRASAPPEGSGGARRGPLPRFSRRSFLLTSGVAAAGLACRKVAPPAVAPAPEKHSVAIVGAGVAGLTAGYRLMQAGVSVKIFEGQKRVGGRMYSLRDYFPEGQVCELGGELVDTGHLAIHGLCAELGLELDDFEKDDPKAARDVWFFDGRRIKDADVVRAFRPIAKKLDAAWEEVSGESVTYDAPNGGERIDRLSIAQWLDEAGAQGWFRKLLEIGYLTEYGLEIGEQSAWNLLMLIDTNPDPFRIFGDSDERFHIRGGNDLVPTRLGERLGDRVETETRLEALSLAPDGSYRLELRRGESSRTVSADRVILALPFTMLREVRLDVDLPGVKRRAIDELGYGTNAKLMVGFSERVWRTQGRSNGSVLSDLPFQLVWESTRLQPGKGGILVCYTGGERGLAMGDGTPAERAEAFTGQLERVFPGVAQHRTGEVRFHWPTFPWMKGSYACYRPGQWTSIAGAEGERVGNLHFAGEHTSIDFQGYMEGGCESGERAAAEILVDLGLRQPAAPEAPAAAEKVAARQDLGRRRAVAV